jgi:methylase of polypeptide subunit release factors
MGADIHPSALEVARENASLHTVEIPFIESRYADDLLAAPDVVVADMPYGDAHYILASIDLREFNHMPPQSLFDMRGLIFAYKELLESLTRRSWHPIVYFETGKVEKDLVEEIIPPGKDWEYLTKNGYSITRIQL